MAPGMGMHMYIKWKIPCTFVFETYLYPEYRLSTDSWIVDLILCCLSAVLAATSVAFPAIRRKIIKK